MADVRLDDVHAELEVRSEDYQEIKSVELPAHAFRVDDTTGKAEFINDEVRDALLDQVSQAILRVVAHKQANSAPE
jgi:hypothetical protein